MGPRVLLLAIFCGSLFAQQDSHFFPERIGDLGIKREAAMWPDPETVLRDLRSDKVEVNTAALRLVGVNQRTYPRGAPEYARLQYSTVGGINPKTVAILTVGQSAFEYAAIVVPSANAWKRIAVLECWCKYESYEDFVNPQHLADYPDQALVARASGGGTGMYEQTEAWFRIRNGRVELVLSFTSRLRECATDFDPCTWEHRWFDLRGPQLVETEDVEKPPFKDVEPAVTRELEEARHFKNVTCTPYKWDPVNFRYIPSGPAGPCHYVPPK
jgi:hypothetical protein